jgi:putative membrane protein
MIYFYIKALHIIFIVTWFAGLFYIVRLFIYLTEAQQKPEPEKQILTNQFQIMMRRLWMGITWPSAILTLIFGPWMYMLYGSIPNWLLLKLGFVAGLYIYHFCLHYIFRELQNGMYRFSSNQLRIWNEVATLFLFAIVFLVVLKNMMSMVWALVGLIILGILLMLSIRLYKKLREKNTH